MIEFGNSLRTAREAKGYTVRQLAELTRMAPTTIDELESENFSRIAAPIYGRGFVKLYCEAVGLEAKPLVDEFMEIYNGNRETAIRERPLPSTPEPSETPPPAEPVVEPPPVRHEQDLFQQDQPEDTAATVTPIPPEDTPTEPTLSRYAAPIRETRSPVDPQAILRVGVLAVVALAILGFIAWGLRSVYRATTRTAPETTPSAVTTSSVTDATTRRDPTPPATAPAPDTARKADRTPQKIPSLYVD